ncbi:hypothetical protein EDC96DRAFT_528927 [Choanephora cucurbitarum]|nr:hypothetical protein EDC96DRAFT_528927 [Choanephora cucurbitarum]
MMIKLTLTICLTMPILAYKAADGIEIVFKDQENFPAFVGLDQLYSYVRLIWYAGFAKTMSMLMTTKMPLSTHSSIFVPISVFCRLLLCSLTF